MCDVYRGEWVQYRDAAELFWRSHMDGATSLNDAITEMVDALSVGRGT